MRKPIPTAFWIAYYSIVIGILIFGLIIGFRHCLYRARRRQAGFCNRTLRITYNPNSDSNALSIIEERSTPETSIPSNVYQRKTCEPNSKNNSPMVNEESAIPPDSNTSIHSTNSSDADIDSTS